MSNGFFRPSGELAAKGDRVATVRETGLRRRDDGNEERAGLAKCEGRCAEGITRPSDEFQLDGGQVTHG